MPPELEAKLIAPDEMLLPDLTGRNVAARSKRHRRGATAVRLPERHLEAVYYDSAELQLARSGITVRYRIGEDGPPWTVELPEANSGAALRRREVMFGGPREPIPAEVADLVRACTRSRPLRQAACPHQVSALRDGLRLLGAKAAAARDTDLLTGRLKQRLTSCHSRMLQAWQS